MKKLFLILGFGILIFVLGFNLLSRLAVRPQVALIAEEQHSPASNCQSNIASFTTTGSCGGILVQRVDYTCTVQDKRGYEGGDNTGCVDPKLAFAHAQTFCGTSCAVSETAIPRPSPTTTPTPSTLHFESPQATREMAPEAKPSGSPPATADPSPLVSCQIETYRLPKDLDLTQLTKDSLTYYRVDPSNLVVSVGERLAFNLNLTNVKPYPLTGGMLTLQASTAILSGKDEPFRLLSQSSLCAAQSDNKTISCLNPQFELGVGQSARPNFYFVAEILVPTTVSALNILYQGTLSLSPFACSPVKVAIASRSTPTPTPTPTISPTTTPVARLSPSPTLATTPLPKPLLTPTPTRAPITRFDPRPFLQLQFQRYQCDTACRRESRSNSWTYCFRRCR